MCVRVFGFEGMLVLFSYGFCEGVSIDLVWLFGFVVLGQENTHK